MAIFHCYVSSPEGSNFEHLWTMFRCTEEPLCLPLHSHQWPWWRIPWTGPTKHVRLTTPSPRDRTQKNPLICSIYRIGFNLYRKGLIHSFEQSTPEAPTFVHQWDRRWFLRDCIRFLDIFVDILNKPSVLSEALDVSVSGNHSFYCVSHSFNYLSFLVLAPSPLTRSLRQHFQQGNGRVCGEGEHGNYSMDFRW